MATATSALPPSQTFKKQSTSFSIDDILLDKEEITDTSTKNDSLTGAKETQNVNSCIDNSCTAQQEDFRQRLIKNMLSFDKLTDRKLSSFSEPPVIDRRAPKIEISPLHKPPPLGPFDSQRELSNSFDDGQLLKDQQRFYDELALKLNIPLKQHYQTHQTRHLQPTTPTKPLFLTESYKTNISYDDSSKSSFYKPRHQHHSLTGLSEYNRHTLPYRSPTELHSASIEEMDELSDGYRASNRHFAPSPLSPLTAFATPPRTTEDISGQSCKSSRERTLPDNIFLGNRSGSISNNRKFAGHYNSPYYYKNSPYNLFLYQHHQEPANHQDMYRRSGERDTLMPYDLHLSKCAYDITSRRKYNTMDNTIHSPNLSPTLRGSPPSSPDKSPSSRQCKSISDSGTLSFIYSFV